LFSDRILKHLRLIPVILLLVSLLTPIALASQEDPPPGYYAIKPYKLPAKPTILDKHLLGIMDKYKIVGLSAAVFNDNKLIWKGGYGWANLETGRAVTPETLFRVASLSKMVTATALMQLYEQGKFSLDDDISQYLGYQVRNPLYPDEKITFRQLLTHTSSILDSGAYETILDTPSLLTDVDIKKILDPDGEYYNPATFGNYSPGSQFSYSNFGTGIVGSLIEKLSGLSFDKYCTQYIFKPLAMDASYEPADIKNWQNIAALYRPDANLTGFKPTKDNFHDQKPPQAELHVAGALAHSPAGGLRVSSTDFAKFLQAHMNGGLYNRTRILKADTADLMHSVQWFGNSLGGFYKQKGLNFHITDDLVPGKRLIGHAGEAYGLIGDAYYDPNNKLGIVFLLNGADLTAESNPYHPVENSLATTLYSAFAPKATNKSKQLKATAGTNFIMINDRKIPLQAPATIKSAGKMQFLFLPAMAAADALATSLDQDGDTVIFTSGQNQATLTAGQNTMLVNGKTIILPQPPFLQDNQIFVPVRELAEALRCNIRISLN
jgi:CubicO group peptidase (beta-lactamase class C family)